MKRVGVCHRLWFCKCSLCNLSVFLRILSMICVSLQTIHSVYLFLSVYSEQCNHLLLFSFYHTKIKNTLNTQDDLHRITHIHILPLIPTLFELYTCLMNDSECAFLISSFVSYIYDYRIIQNEFILLLTSSSAE